MHGTVRLTVLYLSAARRDDEKMPARSGRNRIGVLARVLLYGGMAGYGGRGGHLGGGAEVRARAVNML